VTRGRRVSLCFLLATIAVVTGEAFAAGRISGPASIVTGGSWWMLLWAFRD
jgi:hypothetical protein